MASSSFHVMTRLPAFVLALWVLVAAGAAGQTPDQAASSQSAAQAAPQIFSGSDENLSPDQLETLVSRIALYPDDLLAIVLPASTQPLQLVEAKRLLDQRKSDPNIQPPKTWDPSVVGLLNYPEVIALMNQDLTWTEQLGTSVIKQQALVMDAIQSFRQKVAKAGNLKSNDKQSVSTDEKQNIVIQSPDPQVVYVPTYNPTTVIYAPAPSAPPVYAYSAPYPYYYAPGAAFATGAIFGAAVGFAIGWSDHGIYHGDVNVNVNRNVNVSNTVNRANFNAQRNNLTANRENSWHPSSSAINQAQTRINNRAVGNTARPSVTSSQISSGLAQRSTPRPNAGAAQGWNFAGGSAAAGNRQLGGNRQPGNAGSRQFASAGNQRAGSGSFANRPSGAFSGANNAALSNRASARGNQSLGQTSFQSRAAGPGSGGRSPPARSGGGPHGRR